MDFKDTLRAVRRNGRLIAAVVGAAVLVGVAYALVAPATYASSVRLLLSPANATAAPQEIVQVTTLIQEQLETYTDLVTTPVVLQPAIDSLGLDATPEELAEDVSASANAGSIITIDVVSGSPTQAAETATAVGDSFATLLASPVGSGAYGPAVKATVVQAPMVPDSQESPSLLVALVVGIAAGLAVAFLVVVLREILNPFVRNAADVAKVTGAPILARIPRLRRLGERRSPLVVLREGPAADAFGLLRSTVGALTPDGPRVVVVSSPEREEGRSVVAANLALAFAAVGRRTVLVDADLREPVLSRYFNADPAGGLADVLSGRVPADRLATAEAGFGLTVVPTAPAPEAGKPGELLAQPAALDVVHRLAADADVVVVDAGALVEPPDAAALAPVATTYLLVARAGRTRSAQLEKALATVRTVGGNAVGVVLTDAPTTGPDADA